MSNGINTKPAISFDGLDDFLDIPEAPSLDVANLTLFVVVQFSDPSISYSPTPLAKLPMDSAYQVSLNFDKTPMAQVSIQGYSYPTGDFVAVSGNAEVWSISHDGQTLQMHRNEWASEYAPNAPGAIQSSSGSLRIGAGEAGYTTTFGGFISEVILYNRARSDTERRQVEEYLGWKYGIFQAWPGWISWIGSSNIGCVDRLDLEMDHGLHAYAYLLRPKTAVNRLLLYHYGHGDFLLWDGGEQLLLRYLDQGFAVLTFWMPLYGENPKTIPDVQGSPLTLFTHDEMPLYLEDSGGSFIRFFLEPVVAALNYVSTSFSFDDINMAGISGGGWTTHLMSALDTRIGLSFPTAGSLPEYLHAGPCATGQGDAEQEWAPLYEQRASWPDIYVLGAYGPSRRQTHVLNQYDACCFWGVNYQTYEPYVVDAVSGFGAGAYSVHLDSTHQGHKISDAVIEGVIAPAISAQVLPYRPETDLTLTQSDAPDPVLPGNSLVYTLNVKNNGPSRARNVTLSDTLPPNVSLVSATPSQGICTGTSAVICLVGDLAEGGAASVTLVVSTGSVGFLLNTAQVSYDLPDFRPSDNLVTESTLVDLDQDLDGVGDSVDCAPLDPTAFAIPPEISGMSLGPGNAAVQWDSAASDAGSGVTYDLMRGNLPNQGAGLCATAVCLANGISATQWVDATLPLVGQGLWYLVRGGNA
ncbi:MAG TPA: hypothetical protein VLH58_01325, partial [Candidatus Methylomirabilis sp.]|nr:hypothetical protein [Candidatus Methylomirabilis sp.]